MIKKYIILKDDVLYKEYETLQPLLKLGFSKGRLKHIDKALDEGINISIEHNGYKISINPEHDIKEHRAYFKRKCKEFKKLYKEIIEISEYLGVE